MQTDAVATVLEATGSAIGFLGGWLRDRLEEILPHPEPEAATAEGGRYYHQQVSVDEPLTESDTAGNVHGDDRPKAGGNRGKNAAGKLFQGALMVAVMVVALMVLRRCVSGAIVSIKISIHQFLSDHPPFTSLLIFSYWIYIYGMQMIFKIS